MKTIIIKAANNVKETNTFLHKLEKYCDRMISNAVLCTRLLSESNFYTVHGEVKDAVNLDDYDVFIIADTDGKTDINSIRNLNKAHTLLCELTDIESAKNFVVML